MEGAPLSNPLTTDKQVNSLPIADHLDVAILFRRGHRHPGQAPLLPGPCPRLAASSVVIAREHNQGRPYGLQQCRARRIPARPRLQHITTHILPHTMSYCLIAMMMSIPGYIMGESALSLLGLGIQDPYASWGNLLTEAMGIVQIRFFPWILLPGFFIFLTVICFNVIGDALRDAIDPTFQAEGQG